MPLSASDKIKYKELYLQTAKPYVDDLQKIASLQDGDVETVDVIHRAAHSMGSQSQMMEYNSIANLSRLIEKIFKAKKDEGYILTQETKALMIGDVSRMQDSLASIANNDSELDLTPEIEALRTSSKIIV
ncbi:MAG: Hpt domain-containing protein [Candidatus Levybacteria bacterium]|nr:Hpt domain-containing protein [Candidatus Levybacteria bacterium]